MAMLEVKDLHVYYGVIQALKGVSFEVNQGEVIALIGANGAGKTTTLQTLTGILSPKSGSIVFEGKDLTRTPAHKIVEMGMAHVPEGRRVFADMSVYENLLLGAYTRKDKAEIAESLAGVYKRFPRLEERKGQRAGTLSGGEMKRIEIATVLAKSHKVSIFDEPEAGIDLWSFSMLIRRFEEIHREKKECLILISHQEKIINMADKIMVIEDGEVTKYGTKEEVFPTLFQQEKCQKCLTGCEGGKN